MKKRMYMIPVVVISLLMMAGKCDSDIIKGKTGIIKDMTGLDGCGIVIELDEGVKLEPMMLLEIDVKDGDRVRLSYIPRKEIATTCQVGIPAEILKIKILD